MTKARQQEIQSSLFNMMGSKGNSANSPPPPPPTIEVDHSVPKIRRAHKVRGVDSDSYDEFQQEETWDIVDDERFAQEQVQREEGPEDVEWACPTCTLINFDTDLCIACGIPRYFEC